MRVAMTVLVMATAAAFSNQQAFDGAVAKLVHAIRSCAGRGVVRHEIGFRCPNGVLKILPIPWCSRSLGPAVISGIFAYRVQTSDGLPGADKARRLLSVASPPGPFCWTRSRRRRGALTSVLHELSPLALRCPS